MKVQDWSYCNKPSKQHPDFVISQDNTTDRMIVLTGDVAEQYEEERIEKVIKEMKTYHSW